MRLPPFSVLALALALFSAARSLPAAPPASPSPVALAPGVTLEFVAAGTGDGAFFITPHPISKAQFEAFTKETGFRTEAERGSSGGFGYDPETRRAVQRPGFSWHSPGFNQAPEDPVVDVTRNDATAFLAWASKKAGSTLSLPTSSRWERAISVLNLPATSKPGDSVREWTSDIAEQAPGQPPRAILRGASWLQDTRSADPAALKHQSSPESRKPDIGFRACAEIAAATAFTVPVRPSAEPPMTAGAMADLTSSVAAATPVLAGAVASKVSYSDAGTSARPVGVGRLVSTIVFLLISLFVLAVVAFIVIKLARSLLGQSRTTPSKGPQPFPVPSADSPAAGRADPAASVVNGGIQVRANAPAGTRMQVSWSGAPDGSMVISYQPGPNGLFIPVAGVVHDPRVSFLAAAEGIVPNATVTPTPDGFRVSGEMSDGATVYANWTDASGAEKTGSARYDAASRCAVFQTGQPPLRAAVSLRPLPASARLPVDPPPAAVRAPLASAPQTVIHSHQSSDGFWTGFWMSQMMHPSSSSSRPIGYQSSSQFSQGSAFDNTGSSYNAGSSFDNPPAVPPGSTSLFGGSGGEPAAYH